MSRANSARLRTAAFADLFGKARDVFLVPQVWRMLGLPGEPKENGVVRSPFRDEKHPSFSIFAQGRAWKDQATGAGGDVVEFVCHALSCDHAGAWRWFRQQLEASDPGRVACWSKPPLGASESRKAIEWPAELTAGVSETWKGFAARRRLSYRAVHVAVQAGYLRFLKVNGVRCYSVTDDFRRAAEIRRIDGGLFGERKAYPLRGVDKSWLPGLARAADAGSEVGIFVTEGATDLLTAIDLYTAYRRTGGARSWIPCAMLGASCRSLCPEAQAVIKGRRIRLVPDADAAGDAMAEYWRPVFHKLGSVVDVVRLPRGKDLSEVKDELEPEGIFA